MSVTRIRPVPPDFQTVLREADKIKGDEITYVVRVATRDYNNGYPKWTTYPGVMTTTHKEGWFVISTDAWITKIPESEILEIQIERN
jgi:hypothetical protein